MLKEIGPAIKITLLLTLLTGLIYPLAVTGVTQILFPHQANGSLVTAGGKFAGSELIGQTFAKPGYFHSRPSAAGSGYDGTASGGSNFGPTSQKLTDRVKADVDKFQKENPGHTGPIPADLMTASASGLDPHISPDAAEAQVDRVAKVRGAPADQIRSLVASATESRTMGFLGEPRVNVLKLNLSLDNRYPLSR
jgi:K+-transporting ATPase ATPase C chain